MTQQLTLSGLLDELAKVPQDAIVKLAGFGSGNTPGMLFRHRPFVDGLAITPTMVGATLESTVAEYIEDLRKYGPGMTWREPRLPRFVDSHPGNLDSPMWVSLPHEISFRAITRVEMLKGFALIRTVDTAPVQGPTLQRIPDAEVIERMQVVSMALHGERRQPGPKGSKYLINYVPKDRSNLLQRLAEAREDLDNFEASLQAKKDLVARLEADTARHDYLLGITDEFTG